VLLLPAVATPLPARADEPLDTAAQLSPEEELAEKYKPFLKLTLQRIPCSKSGNVYDPASLDILFGNPDVELMKWPERELIKTAPEPGDLMGLGEEYYLNFPGNPRRPGCRYEQDYLRFREGFEPTIYANATTEEGEGLGIGYWFYYYYNDFANKHEGDWEMIQVLWDDVFTIEEALQTDPTRTVYSSHAGGEQSGWTDKKLQKIDETHPVVYVTTGSHASFYSEGVFMGVAKRGQVFGCDPTTGPHRTVEPEIVYLPNEPPTDPDDPNAWMSFEGAWGEIDRNSIFSGPQGPPVRPRWVDPFEYANQQRDFSDKVPDSVLGIDPSGFFCTVVNAGSDFMIFFVEYPIPVGSAILVTMVLAGLVLFNGVPDGLVGRSLSEAGRAYVPPGPGFLRKERRIRQLARSPLRLYAMHWWLWMLVGLVFVPISVGFMALDQAFGLNSLDDIVNSSVAEPFMQIIGMSIGALIAATVVSACVFAVLRHIDEGKTIGLVETLRHVVPRLPAIAGEVALIGLSIVGLSITIVGIPVAINRSIAWAVAGQAVIIDDHRAVSSMKRSAYVVKGRWLRTFFVVALIGLLIGLPGPFLTFAALVLLEPPVLQTIYPLLTMLYVLVLFPLGFICSGLLYGDLSSDRPNVP